MTAVLASRRTSEDGLEAARLLVRLKLTLLKNSMFATKWKRIGSLTFLTASLAGSIFTASRLASSIRSSGLDAGASRSTTSLGNIVVTATALFAIWVFGPLLVGGVDESLDPTRLALLPLTPREMRRGLVVGSLIGTLPIGTVVALSGAIIGQPASPVAMASALGIAITLLLLCLGASRALAVALAYASRSRRGKDLAMLLASLGAAALFLGTQAVRFFGEGTRNAIIKWLRILPSGQLAVALAELQAGQTGKALLRTLPWAVVAGLLIRLWLRGMDRLLVDGERVVHVRATQNHSSLALVPRALRRWAKHPSVIMASKDLRYLARSPQRRSSLIVTVVIGTMFALLQSMRFAGGTDLAVLGAPIAVLFGIHATNNLLGTDAPALWIDQSAGIGLRQQLVARGLAATPNLIVPTILAAGVLTVLNGGLRAFFVIVVLSLTCWGIPLGVGSVVSVIAPFSQPDVGNPHANRRASTGRGGLVSIMAVVGICSLGIAALPVMVAVSIAWVNPELPLLMIASITLSTLWSIVIWRLGLRLALRVVRGRELNLFAELGSRGALT
jgi:ABC-2 type transport system permease protein